jgi:hypothetical protein
VHHALNIASGDRRKPLDFIGCALQVPVPTSADGLDVDALEVLLKQQQEPRCNEAPALLAWHAK